MYKNGVLKNNKGRYWHDRTLRESVVTRGQVDLVQGALGRVRARQEGRATRTEGREKELSKVAK